jgi:hypothetical protein
MTLFLVDWRQMEAKCVVIQQKFSIERQNCSKNGFGYEKSGFPVASRLKDR